MALILTAIPQLYQLRVKAILLRIMKDPRKILGWNDRGELRYSGKTILGSQLIDLLMDSQQVYENLVLLGREEFYKSFREMNIPQSLISNEQRRL
jgi:hypothetical protein